LPEIIQQGAQLHPTIQKIKNSSLEEDLNPDIVSLLLIEWQEGFWHHYDKSWASQIKDFLRHEKKKFEYWPTITKLERQYRVKKKGKKVYYSIGEELLYLRAMLTMIKTQVNSLEAIAPEHLFEIFKSQPLHELRRYDPYAMPPQEPLFNALDELIQQMTTITEKKKRFFGLF
ncbi:MAG: hypothetical protein OXC40_07920, partial [Proteobacteria bacterium]|nr:hypothetical protein [Pseudomonadota bacterium]